MTEPRAIRVATAALTARLRLPPEVAQRQLGELAVSLGPRVAREVARLAHEQRLGYYPALEFFGRRNDLDTQLLTDLGSYCAVVQGYVLEEVPRQLKPVFSNVQIRNLRFIALMLPGVRPNQPDALEALARHYTPDHVRLELALGTVTKGTTQGLERVAAQKVCWWLRERFARVEITDARLVGD
jgi:hypothetical protein